MTINTSRFGPLEIDPTKTITFQRGLLGFPNHHGFALIQPDADSSFYWLQSIEAPDLAFVVTDPLLFVPDYNVTVREETRAELAIEDAGQVQVLVIVNKVADTLTANLQGPIVMHATTRQATQVVLNEKKYKTRHPILQLSRASGRAEPRYATQSA